MTTIKNCVICKATLSINLVAQRSQLCDSITCELALREHLSRGLSCCSACGCPIQSTSYSDALRVCSNAECRQIAYSTGGTDAMFCRICGIHLASNGAIDNDNLCQSPFCRRCETLNVGQAKGREIAQIREKRRLELVDLVQAQSHALRPELTQQSSLQIIVLPFLEHNLKPASVERRRRVEAGLLELARVAHAQNLEDIEIAEASTEAADIDNCHGNSNASEERREVRFARLSGLACGTCGGKCCNWGGDRAFLTIEKFREALSARPNAYPEEIVADYMARVPDETFENSCIFHGLAGCGLDRAMRSTTCNTFLCSSLHELGKGIDHRTSHFLMAATNFRKTEDPELQVYRIRISSDDSSLSLRAHSTDRPTE